MLSFLAAWLHVRSFVVPEFTAAVILLLSPPLAALNCAIRAWPSLGQASFPEARWLLKG